MYYPVHIHITSRSEATEGNRHSIETVIIDIIWN